MAPLSDHQGYELARIATKRGLPVDLQRQIWADVTKNYYLRGSVTERAATLLQAAWRRLGTTMWYMLLPRLITPRFYRVRSSPRYFRMRSALTAYKRYQLVRVRV